MLVGPSLLVAQVVTGTGSSAVLITGHDLQTLGIATAASIALSALDVRIARSFSDSSWHAKHPMILRASRLASVATETVWMGSGAAAYGIARVTKSRSAEDVALHTTGAVAAGALFIQVVRGALGRARPYVGDGGAVKPDANQYDFHLMRGFTSFDYRSFPSMHAMASFAAVTALTQEMRRRNVSHLSLIAPVLYAGAALPGISRIYLNEHWASDVALGIFIGGFTGSKIVNYSHDHPGNRVDRALLKAVISMDGQGRFGLSVSPF